MQESLRALSALAAIAAITALPAQAVQRTFVASYGNDANTATNCGFANPCRGFTAAQTVTDPNGEIVALDAAGYGAITVTKSLTITANPGFYAGISAGSGNGVTIATAAVKVILRGLNINGVGGTTGVSMTNGTSLTIENCVISNFSGNGVFISAPASVRISDTTSRGNGANGIWAENGATLDVSRSSLKGNVDSGVWISGDIASTVTSATVSDSVATSNLNNGMVAVNFSTNGTARLAVTRSTVSNNGNSGVGTQVSAGTALLTISNSIVTGNPYGLANFSGTLESQGNNTVRQNGTNTLNTITATPGV
jgi:hypothetical protein